MKNSRTDITKHIYRLPMATICSLGLFFFVASANAQSLKVEGAKWNHEKSLLSVKGKSDKSIDILIKNNSGDLLVSGNSGDGEWKLKVNGLSAPPCEVIVSSGSQSINVAVKIEEGQCVSSQASAPEPAPVVSEPDPVISEPAPVVSEPDPVISEPTPTLDPAPVSDADSIQFSAAATSNGLKAVIDPLTLEEFSATYGGSCSVRVGCRGSHIVTVDGVALKNSVTAFGLEWTTFYVDFSSSVGDFVNAELYLDGELDADHVRLTRDTGGTLINLFEIGMSRSYCKTCTTYHELRLILTDVNGETSEAVMNIKFIPESSSL